MAPANDVDVLEDIKRLLILLLMKLGSDSGEIGMALNVDSSLIRRMISTKEVKKLNLASDGD